MASESQAPPPPGGGGNAKYIVLTLLLFGGAAAMWFALNKEAPPAPPATPAVADAGPATPPPPEGLDIEIPPEEPDLGPPVDAGAPTKRIVYRYVGGGGGWDCSGEVPNARAVMAEARRQVQNCYERQLKTNNTLQGTVTLSVKVGASGSVAATQVGGTLRDNEVFACVRNVAQSLRFSPPVGGSCAVVQQPFTLSPRN